jgi:hypothetical protein
MSTLVGRFWMPLAALLALTYLVVILLSGALPERRQLIHAEANGVLRQTPESITRATVVADGISSAFVRQGSGGWGKEGSASSIDAQLAETIERAVKLMHTASPVRMLDAKEVAESRLADFGLDRPRLSITLEDAGGVVLAADFGGANNDGLLQYMRLVDRNDLYLMSGFVGKEWQAVSAGGRRDQAPPGPRPLVPLPIDEVAAVEIFARDKSYRFERDAGGAWLLHRHAPGDAPDTRHVADPAQSELITRALTAFSRTMIERRVAYGAPGDGYGLIDPATVVVLFANDQARPPLDFAIGDMASDGAGRYVLMPDHTEIVTIADNQISSLTDFAARLAP